MISVSIFVLLCACCLIVNASEQTCDATTGVCHAEAASTVKLPKGANAEGKPNDVDPTVCKDRHDVCVHYAVQGECSKNPGWMIVNCPASCKACHLRDPKVRCARENLNMSTSPVYAPGDMDRMFSTILDRFSTVYDVNIVSTDPWVVTFDNFVSDQEADAILSTVQNNWERSTDTGVTNAFGETGRVLSKTRTSSNAWCRHECSSHPDVRRVMQKIEEVTGIPTENSESLQILRYEVGQRYNAHHDSSVTQTKLASGPRILTFFLYLSDVEEGGHTSFPGLGIAVKPKKGRALLWPSTLNSDPNSIDGRTIHEAQAVVKGVKFAANAWIHLYNFQIPNLWGCTGTFDNL